MKLREVYLVNGQTLNDSDTVPINLTGVGKILKLRVQYQATNGATSNTVGRLNGMVSKLQVVDGSNVMHSLSMREEQAKNFYDNGRLPFQQLSQVKAAVVIEEAVIDFRRFPGDVNFYLDTSTYQNPQLQLTHALTISATAGFATGTGKLSVIATLIDSGAPSRLGYVMAKEVDSFASAASGDHNTDLPLDFPIAAILVIDPVDATLPDASLSNFKLTQDNDSFIPINESIDDLLRANAEQFGEAEQSQDLLPDTTFTALGDLYQRTHAWISQAGATAKAILTVVTANQTKGDFTTGETGTISQTSRGSSPHSSVIYRFGDGADPTQIFSPNGVGIFQLKLTNAATGATPKVVVIQQHS